MRSMANGIQMESYSSRRNIVSRLAKVIFINIILLILLGITLCVIACYHFNVGPFYTVAYWSCMYGFDPLLGFPIVLIVVLVGSVVSVRLLPQRFQILAVFVAACYPLLAERHSSVSFLFNLTPAVLPRRGFLLIRTPESHRLQVRQAQQVQPAQPLVLADPSRCLQRRRLSSSLDDQPTSQSTALG